MKQTITSVCVEIANIIFRSPVKILIEPMNLGARAVAQLVKCLLSMHKVLGLIPSTGQTEWRAQA